MHKEPHCCWPPSAPALCALRPSRSRAPTITYVYVHTAVPETLLIRIRHAARLARRGRFPFSRSRHRTRHSSRGFFEASTSSMPRAHRPHPVSFVGRSNTFPYKKRTIHNVATAAISISFRRQSRERIGYIRFSWTKFRLRRLDGGGWGYFTGRKFSTPPMCEWT